MLSLCSCFFNWSIVWNKSFILSSSQALLFAQLEAVSSLLHGIVGDDLSGNVKNVIAKMEESERSGTLFIFVAILIVTNVQGKRSDGSYSSSVLIKVFNYTASYPRSR